MRIPYVIDNETAVLRDILRDVLANHAGRSLAVATAYSPPTRAGTTRASR